MVRQRRSAVAGVLAVLLLAGWTVASAQEGTRQYKAAITRIFLWEYSAFPLFRLNPVFPGTVVRVSNETVYLAARRCYPAAKGGNYVRIRDFKQGMDIATSADLRVKGEVLSKYMAQVEAGGGGKFASTSKITVTPLSADHFRPDTAALRHVANEDCKVILQSLDGKVGGYLVAAKVLHGKVNYVLTTRFGANFDAAAKSTLLALIVKVFAPKEAEIKHSYDSVTFTVSASPAEMSLAIVPERLNLEELARITYYLQGQRGADLENAVDKALTAGSSGAFREMQNWLRNILSDEIRNREKWAENFVSGREMVAVQTLRTDYVQKVDFRKIANYAAAMVLLSEPPREHPR